MPLGCPACQSTSFLLTHWTDGSDGCGLLSPSLFHIEVVDLGRLGPASVAVGRAFQRLWQLVGPGARGRVLWLGHRVRPCGCDVRQV